MTTVALREIAHARAGDKGNISSVGVFVDDPRHYPAVKRQLTPERLKENFGALLKGRVGRYSIDHMCVLNFVMEQALEGGVNESLNLDSHGKSWSFLLLALPIELER
jgi:hypothetical protein